MALLETEGNADRTLTPLDYKSDGTLKTASADLALVVGSATRAESFVSDKQYALLWRDSDILYASPRPMSVFEGSYVLEPAVSRFTVAKVCSAIVPQLYKGLFYTDPPMVLRPRPGTNQKVIDAKTAIFATVLDECGFKSETKWGLEQMALLGTGIWKWGIEYKKIVTPSRKASVATLRSGPPTAETEVSVPTDEIPTITLKERYAPRPFFESRPLDRVLVDPKVAVGDIRRADFVDDIRYVDFYVLKEMKDAIDKLPEGHIDKDGWDLPKSDAELMAWWIQPGNLEAAPQSVTDQATYVQGAVHHSEDQNIQVSPDLLLKKVELIEYWDKKRKILVLDRKRVIYSGKNRFGVIPFLSSNWWNRPKAFYGMGLGLIVGQNQRVDQGTINAILKILSFGVNPIYLRKRDSNAPTQMIRTGLGKVLTVDGETKDAYHLLETPKVPTEIWAALAESEKATESSSGADAQLVQGSSAGPRSSMGRTAGGASMLASASATRLDGPLDNFIEQVFKPFLWVLDMLVFTYFSDAEIHNILGDEMGKDFEVDLQEFHNAKIEFEVLAGSSLAAKRTMAQSMTLLTQIFDNPQINAYLAKQGKFIDYEEILSMWMEASEWKNKNAIIKDMTPEMKAAEQAESQAAQAQSKLAQQSQLNDQKFQQKQQLEDQANEGRIKRDFVREATRSNGMSEAVSGSPSLTGLEGGQPSVV